MTNSSVVGSSFFGVDISGIGDQWTSWIRRLSKRVLLLEFGNDFLRLSETCVTPNGIQLNHISLVKLPPEAFERGVPSEPRKMAGLIREICQEKKIRAHRVAVVLPPEVGYQRIISLPAALTTSEARKYIQDSKNGIQIPFPLAQTDFDLSPLLFPGMEEQYTDQCPYMLTAIPQLLVDSVIEMLQIADFELQLLELGSLSQLRCMALNFTGLPPHQVDLVLELLPNSSDLLMVTCSGLLAFERLSAIRDFPDPDLDDDQIVTVLDAGLSADSFIVNDERYLPLSELDLRVLISDFKKALSRFYELCPGCEIRHLQLVGINSAHPLLVNLLQDKLGLSVRLHRPLLSLGVSGFSLDDVLVQAGLGRLVGLGLGLLSREQLLSCVINISKSDNTAEDKLSAVSIDKLIVGIETSRSMSMLPSNPTESLVSVKPQQIDLSLPLPPQESAEDIQVMDIIDVTDVSIPSFQLKTDDDELSSIGGEELQEEKTNDVKEDDEWPSIGVEELQEEKTNVVKEDDEWPSIGVEELQEEETNEVKEEKVINGQRVNDIEPLEQQADSEEALLLISGLKGDSQASLTKKSSKTPPLDSSRNSDSLGELRFSDAD
jgi:hypothetical protein